MGSPISPLECVEWVERGIALYKKIKDAPEQMKLLGRRMDRLDFYLHQLAELVDKKKNPAGVAALSPAITSQMQIIMKDVRTDAKTVYELMRKYDENIGPKGLVWKYDWFGHLVFGLGSSPDKLKDLTDGIERHLGDLDRLIGLVMPLAHNTQMKKKIKPPPSPILAPKAPARPETYAILFVDGYNTGRSKIAKAYCHLLSAWTTHEKAKWAANPLHSAGINIERDSDILNGLKSQGAVVMKDRLMMKKPALNSLFDNKSFDFLKSKPDIRNRTYENLSMGLPGDLFSKYHFIVTFTKGHELSLIKLRDHISKQKGPAAHPLGKGKIVLIGDYLSGKTGTQIFAPSRSKPSPGKSQAEADREAWNRTTALIKGSVKSFLKKEVGWLPPITGLQPKINGVPVVVS